MSKNSLHELAAGAFGQNGSILINSTNTVKIIIDSAITVIVSNNVLYILDM